MIGCSFVVDREYFGQIGLLDSGMEVYGGENIELGMRVREETNTPNPPHTSLFRGILFMLMCAHYYSFYFIKKQFKPHECNRFADRLIANSILEGIF